MVASGGSILLWGRLPGMAQTNSSRVENHVDSVTESLSEESCNYIGFVPNKLILCKVEPRNPFSLLELQKAFTSLQSMPRCSSFFCVSNKCTAGQFLGVMVCSIAWNYSLVSYCVIKC